MKKLDAEALRLRLALEVEVAYQSPFVNESHDFTQML